MAKREKTVEEYKLEIVEEFSEAQQPKTYKEANKNQAMWELLNSKWVVPISPTLWMSTTLARSQTKLV